MTPAELAEAAVLANLAVLAVVLARLTPFAGLTTIVGALPFAVLGLRHRNRVLGTSFSIALVLVFLLAGFNAATQVVVMVLFGGVVGRGYRERWSRRRIVATSLVVGWGGVTGLTMLFLTIFSNLRELNLEAARVQWAGMSRAASAAGLGGLVQAADPAVIWAIDHWFVSIPAFQLLISVWMTLFLIRLGRPVIRRVERAFGERPEPSAALQAMAGELLGSRQGEFVLLVGDNGSGKTTLLRLMAEQQPDVGLVGGVAWVGQRPESQVVGVRVADDLRWGLEERPDDSEVGEALAAVDLVGFAERETTGLSGGELQRVALAAALLRRPRLLLSDESTAMIDPVGRSIVRTILRRLADDGTTVIHASHLDADAEGADRVVKL